MPSTGGCAAGKHEGPERHQYTNSASISLSMFMFHGSQVALGSRRVGVTLSLLAQASITAIPERHFVTKSFTSMVTTLELFTALWACWYTCAGHSEVLLGGISGILAQAGKTAHGEHAVNCVVKGEQNPHQGHNNSNNETTTVATTATASTATTMASATQACQDHWHSRKKHGENRVRSTNYRQ